MFSRQLANISIMNKITETFLKLIFGDETLAGARGVAKSRPYGIELRQQSLEHRPHYHRSR